MDDTAGYIGRLINKIHFGEIYRFIFRFFTIVQRLVSRPASLFFINRNDICVVEGNNLGLSPAEVLRQTVFVKSRTLFDLIILVIKAFAIFRVSLLQPTSPKFQDFAEQVRERAASDYNYTFSDNEEVSPNGMG